MQKYLKAKVLFIFTLLFTMQANGQSFAWHNPLQENNYVINGRGWNEELKSNYARLPERFKTIVPAKIWNLSGNSAGLTIKFFTN